MNFNNLRSTIYQCRTCLKIYNSEKELISLFDFDQTFPLQKIKFCTMLSHISIQKITDNDFLPVTVCALCVSQIRTAYYFKIQIENSYKILVKQKNTQSSKQHYSFIKEESIYEIDKVVCSLPLIPLTNTVNDEVFQNETTEDINTNVTDPNSDNEIIDYEPEINDYDNVNCNNNERMKNLEKIDNSLLKRIDLEDSEINEENSFCEKDKQIDLLVKKKDKIIQLKKNDETNNKCQQCFKNFRNIVQLNLHVRYKHPKLYDNFRLNFQRAEIRLERLKYIDECSTCKTKFINKFALIKHHADCDNKCIECGLKIPRKDFYFKHMETAHKIYAESSLECPFCMQIFHSEQILNYHIQCFHPDETQSNGNYLSETEESTSNESFFFQCQVCNSRFKSLKSLNQHKSLKHKDENFSLRFRKSKNVQKYSRDEFFEKFIVKKSDDFYCCIPCKKDIFKRSLMLHLKSKHASIRCYRCELCSDAFFRSDYRQRHFASTHSNQYKCFDCELQFDRAYKYDSHMTQHGILAINFKPDEGKDKYDLSPYNIQYIEDSDNYDYSNDHLQFNPESKSPSFGGYLNPADEALKKDEFCDRYITTVSDKMVNCTVCQQEIMKSSVVSHLLWKHAVKKPLKCPFCNERVVKNNARLSHMAKCHPDEYKCKDCGQQFVKHFFLADHLKEVHQRDLTVNPSSGEEDDLHIDDIYFIANKNEDEIIEEVDNIQVETNSGYVEKKFSCQLCSKKFTSSKNLLIHKSHKHRNELLETTTQELSMENPMTFEEFRQNWMEDINEAEMKCLVCDLVLKKKNFSFHIKARHCTTGAFLCAVCDQKFYRPEHRIQHMSKNHHGIFFCKTCNIQFYRNSRYAKHMIEVHEIEMDIEDNLEVDVNLYDLRFVATINKDEEPDSLPSIVHEPDNMDPMEEMMHKMSNSEEMTRNEFMSKFIRNSGRDKKCLACDKTFQQTSIYHHLIHFHATIFPFKCPFCSVRFERSYTRSRHIQVFHPNEYKCNECGLQFSKHIKFVDHMIIEHNIVVTSQKSLLEEQDLSSTELKYVFSRSTDDAWEEEENQIENSSESNNFSKHKDICFSRSQVKIESSPNINSKNLSKTLIYDNINQNIYNNQPKIDIELPYLQFKNRFMQSIDSSTTKCLPCNRIIIKTSVCAHLRLWHASSMMFNCELCPIGFRRADYRQRHMSIHHPKDFKCLKCNLQFHYSSIYREHLWEAHKIRIDTFELKDRDDVDVPLEKMKFIEHVPDSLRIHPADETTKRGRRLSVTLETPISPEAGSFTFKEFCQTFIKDDNEKLHCNVCDEFLTKFSLKKHLKRYHATSKPYNCELCEESFQRLNDRSNHMLNIHPDSFKCSICNTQFHFSMNFSTHMSSVHNILIDIASNKTKTDIDVPIERLRFEAKKNVENLSNKARKISTLNDPIKEISDDYEMNREQFCKKFIRKVRGKNDELQYECLACHKTFSLKSRTFHILHNHAIQRPIGCDLCTSRFFTSFKRLKHCENQHPNDFLCQICVTQFGSGLQFVQHMQDQHKMSVSVPHTKNLDIKNENMRYVKKSTSTRSSNIVLKDNSDDLSNFLSQQMRCNICNSNFDSSRSYRQHMRDHGDDIPSTEIISNLHTSINSKNEKKCNFNCEVCNKKFVAIFALNAHKKFKHGIGIINAGKNMKQKFEVSCEICNFTSHRRDYIEHHLRAEHKKEFQCDHCQRTLSNSNCLFYHLFTNHNIKANIEDFFKCSDCGIYFKFKENLSKHKNVKHRYDTTSKLYFCEICRINYRSKSLLDVHFDCYPHKNMKNFLEKSSNDFFKTENKERSAIIEDVDNSLANDEYSTLNYEPPAKRVKVERVTDNINNEDKLDYLKYLKITSLGLFQCGICEKTKALRKHMLHHIKQHEEIPTYSCDKCPEQFVFKRKYEKHLKVHENGESPETIIEKEHPKFQESKNEISCLICKISFKLTIMLNKHNSIWHSSENPFKQLSLSEQNNKKTGDDSSNFFDQPLEREINMITDDEKKTFDCERCKLVFNEEKFLENHMQFFCVHRSSTISGLQNTNEQ